MDERVIPHDCGEQFRRGSAPRLGPDPTVMSQRAVWTISATARRPFSGVFLTANQEFHRDFCCIVLD